MNERLKFNLGVEFCCCPAEVIVASTRFIPQLTSLVDMRTAATGGPLQDLGEDPSKPRAGRHQPARDGGLP